MSRKENEFNRASSRTIYPRNLRFDLGHHKQLVAAEIVGVVVDRLLFLTMITRRREKERRDIAAKIIGKREILFTVPSTLTGGYSDFIDKFVTTKQDPT
jgi:hypothetical protein